MELAAACQSPTKTMLAAVLAATIATNSAAAAGTAAASRAPLHQQACGPALPDTDFIGDNQFEFTAGNWSACCAKCAGISPCHFWTFEGSPTRPGPCFLKAASSTPAGHARPGRVSGALAGVHGGEPGWPRHPHPPPSPPWVRPGPFKCTSAMDCSLNGRCTSHVNPTTNTSCVCRVGWVGKRCESLDLLPATKMSGFRQRDGGANTSSWGAPVLADALGRYHMWPAVMSGTSIAHRHWPQLPGKCRAVESLPCVLDHELPPRCMGRPLWN